jgi:23S rRNA (pseudouridine1915-N3)-methyltransferase
MKLIVAAVSQRPPDWVAAGWAEYAKRMPRELPLELLEIKPAARTAGKTAEAMMAQEATRIEAQLPAGCRRIALDELGDAPTTRQLAQRLAKWMTNGGDVAFIIGGPDGLDPRIKSTAHETMRLSSLTLPHALVRVILAEALYRAASVLKGHPYHRGRDD